MFNLFSKEKINKEKITYTPHPVVLIILDGYGISPIKEGNAVYGANTPYLDLLQKSYPKTLLYSAGNEVGLPYGEFGNSEVGHLNIGAGRIVYQPLLRVSNEIESDGLNKSVVMKEVKEHLKKNHGTLHLLGLLSPGGVHSHIEHLFSILDWCKENHIKKVTLHVFTDGRDSPPQSAETFLNDLNKKIMGLKTNISIASISGRFYAMDREKKWMRVKKAYDAIIGISKNKLGNIHDIFQENYSHNKTDEFLEPHTIAQKGSGSIYTMEDNDALLFFNIRSDRTREIVSPFSQKKFDGFKRKLFKNLFIATLTQYDPTLDVKVVFPEKNLNNTLGEIISKNKLKQLRIAESAKYPHVTYFFNGGREKSFEGEDRILVPSIESSLYEKNPEMSAKKTASIVGEEIEKEKYDFYLINFANPDMIGHTGNFNATKKGIESLDSQIKMISEKVLEKNGAIFLTADHGNAEEMVNSNTGKKDTEHNIYPVPFVLIANSLKNKKETLSFKESITEPIGALADIAPTILDVMNLEKPAEMTGSSLLNSLK